MAGQVKKKKKQKSTTPKPQSAAVNSADIYADHLLPMHEDVFRKIIKTKIGEYYYQNKVGSLKFKDLFYTQGGHRFCRAHIYDIHQLIEHLESTFAKEHGVRYRSGSGWPIGRYQTHRQNQLLKALNDAESDGQKRGAQILEILATYVTSKQIYDHNKGVFRKTVGDARRKVKALRKTKQEFIEQLRSVPLQQTDDINQVEAAMETMVRKVEFSTLQVPHIYLYQGHYPGIPKPVGNRSTIPKKTPKGDQLEGTTIMELDRLLLPLQTGSDPISIARRIEFLLTVLGITTNANKIRTYILSHRP